MYALGKKMRYLKAESLSTKLLIVKKDLSSREPPLYNYTEEDHLIYLNYILNILY